MGLFDFLKGSKRPHYPITKDQRQTCERLGLTIAPGMFKFDVADMIEAALRDPAKCAIEDAHEREVAQEVDRDNREMYGNALTDTFNKWAALSTKYCLLVAKRGKGRLVDVVDIGLIEFPDDGGRSVKIEVGLPRVTPEREYEASRVEWERYITLKSSQVLHVEPVTGDGDLSEPEVYRALKAKVEAIAASIP